jgi:hypothetical protein
VEPLFATLSVNAPPHNLTEEFADWSGAVLSVAVFVLLRIVKVLGSTVPVEPHETTFNAPFCEIDSDRAAGFPSVMVLRIDCVPYGSTVTIGTLEPPCLNSYTNITLSLVDDPFIPVMVDPGSPETRTLYEIFCLTVVNDCTEICVKFVGVVSVGKPEAFVALSINTAKSPICAPDGIVIVEAVDVALATNAHSWERPDIIL